MNSIYESLGIDPNKHNVREIFRKIIDNEFPQAFVNIITDPFDDERVMTQHQDGDGSKFIQRLLHYYETGDETIFAGMVDDALAMNTGDIAASGFVFGPWLISDVLNVNLKPELKEIIMTAVAQRIWELKTLYESHGFKQIKFLGGETADLPDQVKSGVFDIAITAWANREDLIEGNIKPKDKIYGFVSDGQAVWETTANSGIMSNGLTMTRSALMHTEYNDKYHNLKRDGDFYKGNFKVNDIAYQHDISDKTGQGIELANIFDDDLTVSQAILSPTRQWAIVIREIITCLKEVNAEHMLHGISMNTGGGATKIGHLGGSGLVYIKDMPIPPNIFSLIQAKSGETWQNMYRSFNCGIGIDVVGEGGQIFRQALAKAAEKCHINFYHLGHVEETINPHDPNQVLLYTEYGGGWRYDI